MLFEMYETYSEKVNPDTYNGALITNRDDLIHAIEDAAGYELAGLVVKYLNRVERQAQVKVNAAMAEAEYNEADAEETRAALLEMKRALYDAACDFGDILAEKRLNRDKLHKSYKKLMDIYRNIEY